ncbi:MAG: NAD-dependent deacylase [Desulfamplus sp.]|nr:NAD-dependent deacylase [Desulfamplus sp.]
MYEEAARLIKNSKRTVAFTGAGISVESGIPPFRGKNGLWNKYDPATFEISYFLGNTEKSWEVMREIFYELFGKVKPNSAHTALAELEGQNLMHAVITQNVDNLHTDAGSKNVYEFHGSLKKLVCLKCSAKTDVSDVDLNILPPRCTRSDLKERPGDGERHKAVLCNGVLKPDVVFFGESIPKHAYTKSFEEADKADLFILIGTTGEVAPANMIPRMAKRSGANIIEINTTESSYTDSITDIFLKGKATEVMENLMSAI